MKINFDYAFLDDKGKAVTLGGQPATFKMVAVESLLHAKAEGAEGEPDGKEKRARYDLAVRIKNFGAQAELSQDDIELLKSVLPANHALVVGPAMDLLEGKDPAVFKQEPKLAEAPPAK